jgi:hypothetical protein
MVRRWRADPFGFLQPMGRDACAHRQRVTRHAALDRHGSDLPDGVATVEGVVTKSDLQNLVTLTNVEQAAGMKGNVSSASASPEG